MARCNWLIVSGVIKRAAVEMHSSIHQSEEEYPIEEKKKKNSRGRLMVMEIEFQSKMVFVPVQLMVEVEVIPLVEVSSS